MARAEASLRALTQDDLKELAGVSAAPAISMYVPMERAVVEPRENSLRLKEMLKEVRSTLEQRQVATKDIGSLTAPLQDLLDDSEFWMHQRESLALFRTADSFRLFSLPVSIDRSCYVSDAFVIKPMLGAASPLGEFYILGLSQNSIRLLHCTRDSADEIDLAPLDIPLSLAEALRYDDLEDTGMQFHRAQGSTTGGGRGEPNFHGHGEQGTDHKNQILRFFQAVDPGIRKLLNGSDAPLILAGVEYLHPIYREASAYNKIAQEVIEGNPEGLRIDELLLKARPIFESWLSEELARFGERYGDLAAHGKGSSEIDDVLASAHEGRIDTLFLRAGEDLWGTFDLAGRAVETADEPGPGAVELYDLAARQTILTGGSAYLLSPERMIGGGAVAALHRY